MILEMFWDLLPLDFIHLHKEFIFSYNSPETYDMFSSALKS